ncbi:NAD(P)-dependent oxidoreductase [Acinetobacter sp. WZC-1]|uniref:NAD(P)-dependent oxidoreductase n=1 Tax=Acinetobacter sp. WZC-1 TaxID=3459034 RepID=UPI00403D8D55
MTLTVAFLGLGAMGYRMAAHLPAHFSTVYVWNRNFNKATQHADEFGTTAVSLQQAVQADIIFSCLPTSQQVDEILSQVTVKPGTVWVDCTSGVPESARLQARQLTQQNAYFLDAPVSGQTAGAENASLTFMVGGQHEAFQRALPAMQAMGTLIKHVGDSGSGFAVKAVNNMMLAIHLCAAAEGFTTLKAHGVNITEALDCINASSGKSGVTESVLPQRILNRSFPLTFALALLAKDTGIAVDLIREAHISAPVTVLTQSLIQAASDLAGPDHDFSAAVKMYESWSKITLE